MTALTVCDGDNKFNSTGLNFDMHTPQFYFTSTLISYSNPFREIR
jgi:hypothetical protein